jgi:hypothetical protein
MYEWQQLYEQAVSETDEAKLKTLLDALETDLFLRLQELAKNVKGSHEDERFAIKEAIDGLRRLQTERLHFPPVPKETKKDGLQNKPG